MRTSSLKIKRIANKAPAPLLNCTAGGSQNPPTKTDSFARFADILKGRRKGFVTFVHSILFLLHKPDKFFVKKKKECPFLQNGGRIISGKAPALFLKE